MNIILKPVISEKASAQGELKNCFSFLVNTKANKIEIKKAVEDYYSVSVKKVRTINYPSKRKVKFTKTGIQKGKTNITKKAIVQLSDDNTIDFYNNI